MQPLNFFVSPSRTAAGAGLQPAQHAAAAGPSRGAPWRWFAALVAASVALWVLSIGWLAGPLPARLAAGLLLLGVALAALALQPLWADFWAGLALQNERAFRPQDCVRLHGLPPSQRHAGDGPQGLVTGVVHSINWRSTHILSADQQLLVVPHRVWASAVFENLSRPTAACTLELEVVLDGTLRPSLLQATLGAAMVEAWALGCTLGPIAPVFCVHRLLGAGVAYLIKARVDPRGQALDTARHIVLASVHKHLRFAGLRPVLPGSNSPNEAEQRARDHQRPDDQQFAVDQVELFAVLSPFERRMLVSALHVKHVPAGAQVVQSQDAGRSMFVVAAGVLQVQHAGPPLVIGPGQCFGELSILTGAARDATVVALFPSVLYEVPHTVMAELLLQRPELVDALAQALAQALNLRVGQLEPLEPDAPFAPDAGLNDGVPPAAQIATDIRQFFAALPRPS